jgi:hypothetical protein
MRRQWLREYGQSEAGNKKGSQGKDGAESHEVSPQCNVDWDLLKGTK